MFCGYIAWAADNGVAHGYQDGNFKPARSVTRGAMAAFLYRLANPGVSAPACAVRPFGDVSIGEEFCGVITWAKHAGVATGLGHGAQFGATRATTRGAMASFVRRVVTLLPSGPSATVPDKPTTETPAPDSPDASAPVPARIVGDIAVMPEPSELIALHVNTLGADLPQLKADGALPVSMRLVVDGTELQSFGSIRVQGSSTERWPKKNWTLRFYSDQQRSKELRLKIGGSAPTAKWIVKAEWIDPTTLRNAISYRLWDAIVQSRTGALKYDVDHAWGGGSPVGGGLEAGARGFPVTHPIRMSVNGKHYGLSMLTQNREFENYNLDPSNPAHAFFEFDSRGSHLPVPTTAKTWEKFQVDGIGTWINSELPEANQFSAVQIASIDGLSELINGPESTFASRFDTYLDRHNVIDLFLFTEATFDWDGVSQDLYFVTYDSRKWYLVPWDKDTTFGLFWNGDGLLAGSANQPLLIDRSLTPLLDRVDIGPGSRELWARTYTAFRPQIESRYATLRQSGVLSAGALRQHIADVESRIDAKTRQAERNRWPDRPSVAHTNAAQIEAWFAERLRMLDAEFGYGR